RGSVGAQRWRIGFSAAGGSSVAASPSSAVGSRGFGVARQLDGSSWLAVASQQTTGADPYFICKNNSPTPITMPRTMPSSTHTKALRIEPFLLERRLSVPGSGRGRGSFLCCRANGGPELGAARPRVLPDFLLARLDRL